MRCKSWVVVFCFVEIGTFAVGCRRNANPLQAEQPKPQAVMQTIQSQAVVSKGGDEQSCRAFVQKFYDWYWNQTSGNTTAKSHDYDDALALKPAVLSPELIRLIKRDDARAIAAGGIANLDFDPFLNSQDPEGKYDVVRVTVNHGVCRSELSQRDIVAVAKTSGPGWVFSNFYYSFFSEDRRKKEAPDDNLVRILRQP